MKSRDFVRCYYLLQISARCRHRFNPVGKFT